MSVTTRRTKIGKDQVVVIPLDDWKTIEDKLEDLEALASSSFLQSIEVSRQQAKRGEVFTLQEVLSDLA